MNRYLLNVAYIGTAYRGVTMIEPFYHFADVRTIQGTLERAMNVFKPYVKCEVCCSSRTDARVHALSSNFHVDLDQEGKQPIDAETMITKLNNKLETFHAPIRVLDVEMVDPNIFVAYRNVSKRHYLYRLAVKSNASRATNDEIMLPIEELDRCFFFDCKEFDVEKFKAAASIFVGNHDFRSFMRFSTEEKTKNSTYAHRSMLSITAQESKPCVTSFSYPSCEKHFQFYDIRFTAKSFVYRQIRRIVGTLCAVAEGRITERDVYEMLTIPSHRTWNNMANRKLVYTAPAYGLYFIGVEYKPVEQMSLDKLIETPSGMRINSLVSYQENQTLREIIHNFILFTNSVILLYVIYRYKFNCELKDK